MIKSVTQSDMIQAAVIHSESWIESHRNICAPEFLAIHTPERQKHYLESEVSKGAQLYMLIEEKSVGIVSIHGSLIGNLYVLPDEQNKGYGTKLLAFAIEKCTQEPLLWVLNTNERAKRFYEHSGFRPTGNVVRHTDDMYELELCLHRE